MKQFVNESMTERLAKRSFIAWSGAALAVIFSGCSLDTLGTAPVGADTSSTSSSTASSSTSSTASSSTGNSSSSSSGSAGQGGAGQGGMGGQGGATVSELPRTCNEILKMDTNANSGTYTVDPDGSMGSIDPFEVTCKMTKPDGWTLVGLEAPNETENLKLLGVEKGTPANLIAHQSAIIGVRFKGLYSKFRVEWDTKGNIEFDVGNVEIFDDTVALNLPITNAKSSDSNWNTWIGNGASFCRAASKSANKLPGDTSWAVKPSSDMYSYCGCNGGMWTGQGAFYGGTGPGCTICGCAPGGFVGVKDSGQPKNGAVNWETRIYVL